MIRRLDHVAVAVRNTETALEHFRDRLGLLVVAAEERPDLSVRLTYLDAGNTYIQLVEPTDGDSPIGRWIEQNGEGLHHICFAVDDVRDDLAKLSPNGASQELGSGRGRPAGFVSETMAGVMIECTAFHHSEDVEATSGWIEGAQPEDGR